MIFPFTGKKQTSAVVGRGIFFGGYGGSTNPLKTIGYVTIDSAGNATAFGDLTLTGDKYLMGCGSSTRGVIAGGNQHLGVIQYVTVASTGDAIDFGDLTVNRYGLGALSSDTRGCFFAGYEGYFGGPVYSNVIDYVTIASTGNATDFGDATSAKAYLASCSSPTRGITGGGSAAAINNEIEYITIASTGDATDFGDLTAARRWLASCSSATRGLFGGGYLAARTNVIEYVTIASTGNATDFGDLTVARAYLGGLSNAHGGI